MKCPACLSQLNQVKSKSAVVDVCPNCRGIWFDSGELAAFVRPLSASEQIPPEKIKLFKHRDVKSPYKVREKDRFCPKCGKKLKKFNFSYDSNIFLDKCENCGGIWADGGEVAAIASYLKEDPTATDVGRYLAEAMTCPDQGLSDSFAGYFLFVPRLVIPISDDTPRERFPFVTVSLIALCVLAFLGQMSLKSNAENFIKEFGFVPARFFSIGLITSMFLHTGVLHLAFNMLFLWLFGDNVEDRFSRLGYLVFCLCSGLFACFLHGIFNRGSSVPAIGASGMVSGIMGAYLIFYPQGKITMWCLGKTFEVSVVLYLGGWFIIQLASAFASKNGDISQIAWFAHIGGFFIGLLVAYFKKIAKQAETAYK